MIRVLVVDDNETVRWGICQVLQPQTDIKVVCEASDGTDAIRKALEHRPDVVLMDVSMPMMNGPEAAKRIKEQLPSTVIIFVSQFYPRLFANEAKAAGAAAYILKSNVGSELIPALHKIQRKPF